MLYFFSMRNFDDIEIHPEAEISDVPPSSSASKQSSDGEWELCSDDSNAGQSRRSQGSFFSRERSSVSGGGASGDFRESARRYIYSSGCSQCSCFVWVILLTLILILLGL